MTKQTINTMNNDWKKQIREDYKNIISDEQIEKTIGYYENILKQQRQKDIEEIKKMDTNCSWYEGDKECHGLVKEDVLSKLDKTTSEEWEIEFEKKFLKLEETDGFMEYWWNGLPTPNDIKQFIASHKAKWIEEERARIIPKIHKIRAGCPAKSFARQQAKELLKELMGVEK